MLAVTAASETGAESELFRVLLASNFLHTLCGILFCPGKDRACCSKFRPGWQLPPANIFQVGLRDLAPAQVAPRSLPLPRGRTGHASAVMMRSASAQLFRIDASKGRVAGSAFNFHGAVSVMYPSTTATKAHRASRAREKSSASKCWLNSRTARLRSGPTGAVPRRPWAQRHQNSA